MTVCRELFLTSIQQLLLISNIRWRGEVWMSKGKKQRYKGNHHAGEMKHNGLLPARSIWILMTLETVSPPWLPIDAAAAQVLILSSHNRRRCWRCWGHSDRWRVTDSCRFPDQMLGDERIEDQQNYARQEKKEHKRSQEIELGPVFSGRRSTWWLAVCDFDFCQRDDWTVNHRKQENKKTNGKI